MRDKNVPEGGDVQVQGHHSANCGEPPLVPERLILRVLGVIGPSHFTRFGSALGLGRKGSSVGCCFVGCGGSESCGSLLAL